MRKMLLTISTLVLMSSNAMAGWVEGTIKEIAEYPHAVVITFTGTGLPEQCTSNTECTKRIVSDDAEKLKRIFAIALTAKSLGSTVELDLCSEATKWCGIRLK